MPFLPTITASIRAIETWRGQIGPKHFKQHSLSTVLVGLGLWAAPLQLVAENEDQDCAAIDLILTAEKIYTSTDVAPAVEAVGIARDKIAIVGSRKAVVASACSGYRVLNFESSAVYPGFTDAHQHLEGVGRRTKTLSLFGINTLSGTVRAIEQWAKAIPENEWILGRGWIEREWTDQQRFLTKHDVDPFTEKKPLFMPRADGVSALVNTAALKLAGVTKATLDPEGGRFDRNEDGEPTGYVLGNAMKPFRAILPDDTDDYLKDNLIRGLKANAVMGWTQTQDAGMSYRLVDLLRTIHQEGNMTHRVYVAVPVSEAMERFKRGREKTDDDFLDVRGIKVFIDGTLGSRGAALIDNYADSYHNGFMGRTPKSTLMPILHKALTDGVQIETHVIGDRAVRSLLDWYDEAFTATPRSEWASNDLRWRLEHAQIIQPGDQDRFVSLGILPSMQPSHGIGDLNFAPARLGSDRLQYAYPWKDLVDKGLKILGGSDAPVELGDPRIEFYAAIARKRLDGTSGDGWHPELAVSRETALKMFTIWPAYGAFQDHLRGSIEVGKYADFTVFDRDLMTVPADDILNAKVVMTIVGGKIAYDGRSEPES